MSGSTTATWMRAEVQHNPPLPVTLSPGLQRARPRGVDVFTGSDSKAREGQEARLEGTQRVRHDGLEKNELFLYYKRLQI